MAQNIYDITILGAGPGGYSAALRASQLGLKVALVEKDRLGGECLHRACIPTKSLSRSAAVFETVNHSAQFGIDHEKASVNWEKVQKRKEENIGKLYKGLMELIKLRKIDIFNGMGQILENQNSKSFSVSVNADVIKSKNLIIATGTRPGHLINIETDHINILTTGDALSMKEIPKRILIVGGGSSGIEFASIFRSFGSEVTLIEQSSTVLTEIDEEVVAFLLRQFKRRGINVITNTLVKEIDQINGQLRTTLKLADSSEKEINVHKVLLATGRIPVTEDFGLDNIGVTLTEKKFVKVNEFNEAVERVFAVGDVVDTPAFAHVAYNEGINVVDGIYGFKTNPINYKMTPCALSSYPEIAKVGLTEKEAKFMGIDVSVGRFPMQANAKAQILGESMGMVKIISERRGSILGVHAVGPNVSEIIAEGQLATNWEADGEDLASLIHPHPTVSEAFGEAAMEMVGKAFHTISYVPEKRRAA